MKNCITKLHASLRDFDTGEVTRAAAAYRSRGREDKAANVAAVEDHLRDLRQQRVRLERQILAAWKERDPDGYATAEGTAALELKGETEAEIRAREAAQAKAAEEEKKKAAAPPPTDFTLTGSNSPADLARARGQQELAPAPTPDTITDFGEKIGGARKDTAEPTGGRGAREDVDEDSDPAWRKRYIAMESVKQPGTWTLMDKRTQKTLRDGWNVKTFTSQADAEAAIPLMAVARQHSVGMNSAHRYEIWRRVADRKRVKVVQEDFATHDDAMRYLALHAVEIIETKTSFGEEVLAKPEKVMRKGVQRRTAPATPAMFTETFGFRGVEFGNWNNQAERQEVMNHAFDGLLDLANTLNLPPRALSLNGDLGLAFGARGQGLSGARAHYEPAYGVINLTKMAGAGALAHEWFHALDHYFGRVAKPSLAAKETNERGDQVFKEDRVRNFATYGLGGQARPEVQAAYRALVDTMYRKAEKFVEDTALAEKFVGKMREEVRSELKAIRDNLAAGPDTLTYMKRNNKPASAEQIAAFDVLADRIIDGKDLEVTYRPDPKSAGKRIGARGWSLGRHTNDSLDGISTIYKAVRGRTGFSAESTGTLDRVRATMRNYAARVKMLEDARAGTEKEKGVPTSYAMNAKAIDQGRASDYWTTEHEMAARAFSAYVEDKLAAADSQSDFLSYGSHNGMPMYVLLRIRPFPEGTERKAINEAFDHLFKILETKETDRGVALFSRGEGTAIARTELESVVERLGLKAQVIESEADLPAHLQDQIAAEGAGGEVRGAFDPTTGEVWLVRDRIGSEAEGLFVALHESAHRGLTKLFGADLKPVLEHIYLTNKNVRKAADKLQEKYGYGPTRATEEVLADMAMRGQARNLKGWQRFVEFLRKWLIDHGFKVQVTDEMAEFIAGAAAQAGKDTAPVLAGDGKESPSGIVATLEARFGSDEALGVRLSEDGESTFPDGSAAVFCSNCALQVKKALPTRTKLYGFWDKDNPNARVILDGEEGHDFAIVDNRYLVDPWIKLVAGSLDRAVFDMRDAADKKIVDEWYGPRGNWERGDDGEARFSRHDQLEGMPPEQAPPRPLQRQNLPLEGGESGNQASWDAPEPTKLDTFIYSLQNKQIDLKKVVAAIRTAGREIADRWNPYLQEELYHGRTAKFTQDFIDKELKPLFSDMAARGANMRDLEEYLHARHAEERNEQIARVNPDMPDGGSGMDTAAAREYLEALEASRRRTFEALARRIDAITKRSRALLVEYGLEAPETIAAWEGAYEHYVPLMREDADQSTGTGTGQGYSVKGSASKRATGSSRNVVDILANIAMQRERAIVRGEKNRVALALYGLAKLNPNTDFWKVDQPPTVRGINERTGLVEDRVDPLYKSRDNVVMARVYNPRTGKIQELSVIFEESDERAMRMAHALKNLDADDLGHVLGASAKITRYFASINTQYNPIFGIVNLTRDVQGAMLNLSTTPIRGKQKQVLQATLSALRGIYIDLRDTRAGEAPTSSWAQLWEEFQREGGQTGYRDMFATSKARAEALESEIKKITEGKAKHAGRAIFDWLSDYNVAGENAVRLAVYKVGKEQGMTNQQAASMAKNVTVNFNRKGQVALQAGALYAFFNASAQGTARMLETLKGPAGKKVIAGGLILGGVQAVAMAMAGFDEDEPPQFVRERSIIIPIGGKKYISIPMPLGFHVIPNLSRISTEYALSGFKGAGKRVAQLVGVIAETFNPLGGSGFSIQTISPTAIDPLVALAENKDWTGKPIAKEDMNKLAPTPGPARAKDTASWWGKRIAEAVNALTGGTKYTPGAASPTPDQIDYLIGQVTGGLGRELSKGSQTVESAITGEELPTHKVPLLGRLYGSAEGQAPTATKFYANLKAMNEHEAEIKGRRKDGLNVGEYVKENPDARLFQTANQVERRVSELRTKKREAVEKGREKGYIKLIDQQITAAMSRFNEQVERVKSPATAR